MLRGSAGIFLLTEWEEMVDAWQLDTWEAYRDVRRLGRKTRLREQQRAVRWSIFDRVRAQLQSRGFVSYPGLFSRLAVQLQPASTYCSTLLWSTNPRTAASRNCGFSPRSALINQPASSLPATSANGSSSNPSLGKPWASIFGTLPHPAHQLPNLTPDQNAGRPFVGSRTVYCRWETDVDGKTEQRMGTISVFNGPSTHHSRIRNSRRRKAHGRDMAFEPRQRERDASRNGRVRPVRRRSSTGLARPSSMPGCHSRCSTSTLKRAAVTCRSAPCIWPKAWSFARLS